MRDPKRIHKILERLRNAWLSCPDLRLGQIMVNSRRREAVNLFNVEDEALVQSIEKTVPPAQRDPALTVLYNDRALALYIDGRSYLEIGGRVATVRVHDRHEVTNEHSTFNDDLTTMLKDA